MTPHFYFTPNMLQVAYTLSSMPNNAGIINLRVQNWLKIVSAMYGNTFGRILTHSDAFNTEYSGVKKWTS